MQSTNSNNELNKQEYTIQTFAIVENGKVRDMTQEEIEMLDMRQEKEI